MHKTKSPFFSKIANFFFTSRCIFCDYIMDYRTHYCVCHSCSKEIEAYYTADGTFLFIDKIRESILRFKFANATDYAQTFATIMAAQLKIRLGENLDFDVIVPVPISKKRFQKRGYNQSALLAIALADLLEIPTDLTSLIKIRETNIQSTLSAKERAENLKDAFDIIGNNLYGKRVLLIDDVRTTGATLNETAKTLMKKGKTASVFPWVIARAE